MFHPTEVTTLLKMAKLWPKIKTGRYPTIRDMPGYLDHVWINWRWWLIEDGMERKKQVDEKLFMLLRPILRHVSQCSLRCTGQHELAKGKQDISNHFNVVSGAGIVFDCELYPHTNLTISSASSAQFRSAGISAANCRIYRGHWLYEEFTLKAEFAKNFFGTQIWYTDLWSHEHPRLTSTA